MFYVILTAVLILLAVLPNAIKDKYNIAGLENCGQKINNPIVSIFYFFCMTLIFMILWLVAGLRYFVGTDYNTYLTHQIPLVLFGGISDGYKVEPLYNLLIRIGYSMGNIQWIFLLTHLIIVFFISVYIFNRSCNYMWSIFIFIFSTFYSFSLNGMRQSIATAIFLYSTKYIAKGNMLRYFLFITIACLFHSSAIIYFPFYFLRFLNLVKLRNLYWIFPVIFLFFVNSKLFYRIFFNISMKYNFYTKFYGSVYDNTNSFNKMYMLLLILNLVVVIIFYLLKVNDDNQLKRANVEDSILELNIDFNIQLIATIFSAISFVIPGAFRVIYMFIPIQITLIPNMLNNGHNKRYKMLFEIILVVMYIVLFYVLILQMNQNETLPYKSVLK